MPAGPSAAARGGAGKPRGGRPVSPAPRGGRGAQGLPAEPRAGRRGAGQRRGTGCCSLCLLAGRSIPRQTPRLAACALSSPLISLSK